MENKLTWVELKKVVARQTNLTEKEVNLILTAWLNEMTAALQRGEEVRINGLGIFKLKTMKERKSVNVTTGEAIMLPETQRLTYTMAAGLEEQMQDDAPKAADENDPIAKLSKQADEILDILGSMDQAPEPIVSEPFVMPEPELPVQPAKPAKKQRLWLTALITFLVFLLLAGGAIFFLRYQINDWLKNLRLKAETASSAPANTSQSKEETFEDYQINLDEGLTRSNAYGHDLNQYRVYNEFIATEDMPEGSRLTLLALRYYGKKELWVFIYDANKENLTHPDYIQAATPVRVPKLSQEVLDLEDPELQRLVHSMYHEFIDN